MKYFILFLFLFLCGMNVMAQRKEKHVYQQINLEEMIRRHISKNPDMTVGSIEGLYTVSAVVSKHKRGRPSSHEREKVVSRKDNYAKVAILKNWPGSETEYVEVSLNDKNAPQYPIVAEITSLSDAGGYLFKHFEPKGEPMTFTFTIDQFPDILEGAYSFSKGRAVITYRLSYLKTYPKTREAKR